MVVGQQALIGYADVEGLDEHRAAEVGALFEHADTIWDMPEDLGQVEAWEELVAECERVGFPHLAASARFGQYTTLSNGGLPAEALEAYVRLMQLIHRHGDLIDPRHVGVALGAVATATMTVVEDPEVPADRIGRMIDLVETEVRGRGGDVAGVLLARAVLATACGDRDATYGWLERWRAEGSSEWRLDSPGVVQMEIPLIAVFDAADATQTLEARLRAMGVDPRHVAADGPDAETDARLVVQLAFLHRRTGRDGEAEDLAGRLLDAFGLEQLVTLAPPESLLRVLEHRPAEALVTADFALGETPLDGTDRELLAALARSRVLADPTGEEGALLRALATEAADAHDRRGGTDVHRRELEDFWTAGLPESPRPGSPRPEVVDDPDDRDGALDRAETILAAGWLPRRGVVSVDDPPIALKDRYVELLGDGMQLLSAETDAEADSLANLLTARADRLRCAAVLFTVPLLHGMRAAQNGVALVPAMDYRRAQAVLLEHHEHVPAAMQRMARTAFSVFVQTAVADPDVPWPLVQEILGVERRLRDVLGAPRSDVLLAHAEVAAHVGDTDLLQRLVGDLMRYLGDESDLLDRHAVDLEVVRLSAWHGPDYADHLARWVAERGDAEQTRAARAWSCWAAVAGGDDRGAVELLALLDSVEGDVEALGSVPGWVLLEGLAPTGADVVLRVVDDVLEEAEPLSAVDLDLMAAAGSALLALAPGDPRGPDLRDRALRIAHGLDARDDTTRASSRVRSRWFPDAPGAAAPAPDAHG